MVLPTGKAEGCCDSPEGEWYHLGGQWLTQRVWHTQGPGDTRAGSVWGLQWAHCAWHQVTLQDLVQEALVARQILECCSEGSEPWKGLSRPVSPEQRGLGASLLIADHRTSQRPSLRTSALSSLGSWPGIFLGDATSVVFKRWKWKRKKKAANRHNFPPEAILARKQLESLLIILKCF